MSVEIPDLDENALAASDEKRANESLIGGEQLFKKPITFLRSVSQIEGLPESSTVPEIGIVGKSNVGKSSLVNAVCGRRTLAKVSHTPGRTQLLNFFDLGGLCYLVDMPGYGYAKVSKKMRQEWQGLIFDYLRGRTQLKRVLLLIDGRHGLKANDLAVMDLLDDAAVIYQIVLTKADKVKAPEMQERVAEVLDEVKLHPACYPEVLVTSANDKIGLESLRGAVFRVLKDHGSFVI